MRILIVEDNEADREWVKEMLEHSGFRADVDCSERLDNAKTKLDDLKYNLIFLDLRLPDSNGIETVSECIDYTRSRKVNAKTPIIVMTRLRRLRDRHEKQSEWA